MTRCIKEHRNGSLKNHPITAFGESCSPELNDHRLSSKSSPIAWKIEDRDVTASPPEAAILSWTHSSTAKSRACAEKEALNMKSRHRFAASNETLDNDRPGNMLLASARRGSGGRSRCALSPRFSWAHRLKRMDLTHPPLNFDDKIDPKRCYGCLIWVNVSPASSVVPVPAISARLMTPANFSFSSTTIIRDIRCASISSRASSTSSSVWQYIGAVLMISATFVFGG